MESDVQRAITAEATKQGYYVVKIIQCNKNGFPDLLLFKDGGVIAIEVKAPGKKARPLQIYRHKELTQYGIKVHVIDSIEKFKHLK